MIHTVDSVTYAETTLFGDTGLDRAILANAIGELAGGTADLADLFFQRTVDRSWRMENGKIIAGGSHVEQGVGARVAHDEAVAFAHSSDLRPPALLETVRTVRALARHGGGERHPAGIAIAPETRPHGLYAAIDAEDRDLWAATLTHIDALARAADSRVSHVEAHIRSHESTVLILDAEGRLSADRRPAIKMRVTVIINAGGRSARGSAGLGGRHGLDRYTDADIAALVDRATGIAQTNVDARAAPSGMMPVVLAPGYPGVLFHEAVGHGLEADHLRKRLSAFDGRIGKRIAAPGVTVIDDGSIPARLGSIGIDDEGTPGGRTVLVEDGILTGLMQDRLNARLMEQAVTGNGRRQSYAHLPMPRMTNTFLAAGDAAPADILKSVKHGIYAAEFGGGQVDIVSGRFNFTTTQAWLIEDGHITAPIEAVTLIGVGHEALRHISMIGNDLRLDDGEAVCGKQGQTVDVGVGQPTIRIDAMMVGGRA